MSGIAQRSDLVTQINNYANRTFASTYTDLFIQSAESRFWYGEHNEENPSLNFPPLRIRAMETSATVTISSQSTALPTGFLASRRLYISSSDPVQELSYITPDIFWKNWVSSSTGTTGLPKEFTIEGENFIVGPSPDTSYTANFLYYKALSALVGTSDTNWILTNAPILYLAATLTEAFAYIRNMDMAVAWNARAVALAASIQKQNSKDRFAGPWQTYLDVPAVP